MFPFCPDLLLERYLALAAGEYPLLLMWFPWTRDLDADGLLNVVGILLLETFSCLIGVVAEVYFGEDLFILEATMMFEASVS